MTKPVFVDTGAFVALANEADQYHEAAKNCLVSLAASKRRLITSNFVLDETYTNIRKKAGIKAAIAFGEQIQADSEIRIVSIGRNIEKKAWAIFKKYDDRFFSYTDCTSFALMADGKLTEVFAFDRDFKIFGFHLLL